MSLTLNGKTYTARGVANAIANWLEQSAGIAAGFSPLTGSVALKPLVSHIKWKLVVPVIQTDADECACPGTILRTSIVDITIRFDAKATAVERADVLARTQALVLTAPFMSSVDQLVAPIPS